MAANDYAVVVGINRYQGLNDLMGPENDAADFNAWLRKPTGGAVQGARDQLVSLKKFLIDNDIISIKGNEDAHVDEAPPYNRWNFAYINIPGVYEEGLSSIYYICYTKKGLLKYLLFTEQIMYYLFFNIIQRINQT